MTGHIAHHAAKSLMFPLPAPGSQPKRDPIAWDPAQPYRGLGVREVWIWRKGELKAYQLRGDIYVEIPQSAVIPGLTPSFIQGFLDYETQTEALRKMRSGLRSQDLQ